MPSTVLESLGRAIAVVLGIAERTAQVSHRQALPQHGNGRERPTRSAGRSRGQIVPRFVMAIAATHGADAVTIGAANDVRHVRAPRIALKRRLSLVTVQAARVLENCGDFGPDG